MAMTKAHRPSTPKSPKSLKTWLSNLKLRRNSPRTNDSPRTSCSSFFDVDMAEAAGPQDSVFNEGEEDPFAAPPLGKIRILRNNPSAGIGLNDEIKGFELWQESGLDKFGTKNVLSTASDRHKHPSNLFSVTYYKSLLATRSSKAASPYELLDRRFSNIGQLQLSSTQLVGAPFSDMFTSAIQTTVLPADQPLTTSVSSPKNSRKTASYLDPRGHEDAPPSKSKKDEHRRAAYNFFKLAPPALLAPACELPPRPGPRTSTQGSPLINVNTLFPLPPARGNVCLAHAVSSPDLLAPPPLGVDSRARRPPDRPRTTSNADVLPRPLRAQSRHSYSPFVRESQETPPPVHSGWEAIYTTLEQEISSASDFHPPAPGTPVNRRRGHKKCSSGETRRSYLVGDSDDEGYQSSRRGYAGSCFSDEEARTDGSGDIVTPMTTPGEVGLNMTTNLPLGTWNVEQSPQSSARECGWRMEESTDDGTTTTEGNRTTE
ncbi:hypothetical protein BT69DRAFT_1296295 [Atractiella rhizophila]|nr:hypothetical protein BT69DRAFT_1296295 [Atractiella rhizophila]